MCIRDRLKGNGSVVAQAQAGTDYAAPAADTTATLSTTWTGSAAPYTQAVAISGMTADAKIEVGLASNATAEEYAAAAAAQLMCTAQEMCIRDRACVAWRRPRTLCVRSLA